MSLDKDHYSIIKEAIDQWPAWKRNIPVDRTAPYFGEENEEEQSDQED